MKDVVFLPMLRMAELVRKREISAGELVRAHLQRIETVNPSLNAVVEVAAEDALAEARRLDENIPASDDIPPFYGVPMTVKGAWDCAGLINTGGTLGRKGVVPMHDATTISRMRHAGAIPIGVTNLPEFSLAFESDNLIYGRTNNPYLASRTAGGSGGGGGAAIASGCSPFEVGGDLGGSIRLPSHFCGIAGLKPTLGRVPLTGYFPPPFGVVTLAATAGPMARTVADLAATLPLLSGPDGFDANVCDARLRPMQDVRIPQLRIAFHTNNGICPVTPQTAAIVQRAAEAIATTGAVVEESRPEGLEQSMEIFLQLLGFDGGAGVRHLIHLCGTGELSKPCQDFLAAMAPYETSGPAVGAILVRRDGFRSAMAGFFRKYDALLCPVNAFPALPHGTCYENLSAFSYTAAHNLSGCPGAVVRCGTSDENTPIGVQVVAPLWREDIALAIAAHLEQVFGGWQRPQ